MSHSRPIKRLPPGWTNAQADEIKQDIYSIFGENTHIDLLYAVSYFHIDVANKYRLTFVPQEWENRVKFYETMITQIAMIHFHKQYQILDYLPKPKFGYKTYRIDQVEKFWDVKELTFDWTAFHRHIASLKQQKQNTLPTPIRAALTLKDYFDKGIHFWHKPKPQGKELFTVNEIETSLRLKNK